MQQTYIYKHYGWTKKDNKSSTSLVAWNILLNTSVVQTVLNGFVHNPVPLLLHTLNEFRGRSTPHPTHALQVLLRLRAATWWFRAPPFQDTVQEHRGVLLIEAKVGHQECPGHRHYYFLHIYHQMFLHGKLLRGLSTLTFSHLVIESIILAWSCTRLASTIQDWNHFFEVQSSSEPFCSKNFEKQVSVPHAAQILFQLATKEHGNVIIARGFFRSNICEHCAAPIRRCRFASNVTPVPILSSRTLESTIKLVRLFWAAFPTRLQGSGLPESTTRVTGSK